MLSCLALENRDQNQGVNFFSSVNNDLPFICCQRMYVYILQAIKNLLSLSTFYYWQGKIFKNLLKAMTKRNLPASHQNNNNNKKQNKK